MSDGEHSHKDMGREESRLSGRVRRYAKVGSSVGGSIAAFLCLLSLPGVICGFGLIKLKSWARVLTLVLAVLNLPNVPLGTALGIYSFWVLLNQETELVFSGKIA